MPFVSRAQERWGNSPAGRKALGDKLGEWNSSSKGLDLPERKGAKKMARGGMVESVGGGKGEGDLGLPDFKQMATRDYEGNIPVGKASRLGVAEYAKGGPVIQSGRSIFVKQPDVFRTSAERQDYSGKGPLANPEGDGKSLPPIKPRK